MESIEEAGIEIPQDILYNCIELSKYYISTRYPDVWSEGSPEDYFTEREASEVISKAEEVLKWVVKVWRELLRSEEENV